MALHEDVVSLGRLYKDFLVIYTPTLNGRIYECRCVLPLLSSSVEVIAKDRRAPQGLSPLLKVSQTSVVHLLKFPFQQVYNAETSLLFYSEHTPEVYNWARVIQQTIQYAKAQGYVIMILHYTMAIHRTLQSAFGSSTTSQKENTSHSPQAEVENSPQSLLSATTTQQLDMATLTPVR